VITEGADLGIALDGDADRLIMCDEKGQLIDGDQLMAMIATRWQKAGELRGGGIVSTQMSNLGMEHYLKDIGLRLHRANVGDRYVIEKMKELGCNLGGEPSGHIVLDDYSTTGDALIAALQVMALMITDGRPLSKASRLFTPVPQVLNNVRYGEGNPLENERVQQAIADAQQALGDAGRVFIRKSGTEPLIRVMVEGEKESEIRAHADTIADAITTACKPRLATG
jgi:phosphoglucosamine mutase